MLKFVWKCLRCNHSGEAEFSAYDTLASIRKRVKVIHKAGNPNCPKYCIDVKTRFEPGQLEGIPGRLEE